MSEPAIARPGDTPSRSTEWFRQNALLIGIIGSVASIISIPLAIYFFSKATSERELVYVVNPARAVVFKPGQTSQLTVLLRDRPIRSDVTAVQVAFWNAGNEPIRPEDVLEPIVLRLGPSAQLIEATVRKMSRPAVATEVALIHPSKNESLADSISVRPSRGTLSGVRISWKILEKNDGGVVQLVFTGNPEAAVTAEGVVVGQRTIGSPSAGTIGHVSLALAVAVLLTTISAIFAFQKIERYESPNRILWWVFSFIGLAMISLMYAAFRVVTPVEPPFGF